MSSSRRVMVLDDPHASFNFPSKDQGRTSTELDYAIEEVDENNASNDTQQPVKIPNHDQWQSRRISSNRDTWTNRRSHGPASHSRQRSLTEALRHIRQRRGSVSENAHEIADALKAPVSFTLVGLCSAWYFVSILSNATSKTILIAFRKPVTLTVVQFAFVSSWCIIASALAHLFPRLQQLIPTLKYKIRSPSREILSATLPLTAFQIGGHILNSDAMARVPVSLVHTIKGLSPLFTVLAYRVFFRVQYSTATYLSLIPLTLGVVMACSAGFTDNYFGLLCSFGSALLFVTQNIASKRIFNDAARAEAEGTYSTQASTKPDKLNLLCYSSGTAFLITCPIWLWSEGFSLLGEVFKTGTVELSDRPGAVDHGELAMKFFLNGTFHFAQSLVAFILLSMVSPVTYSVASLMKRVSVIIFAILWYGNPISNIQGMGIGFTFLGLYLYDRTNDATRADRRARLLEKSVEQPLLPTVTPIKKSDSPNSNSTPGFHSQYLAPLANFAGLQRKLDDDTSRNDARPPLNRASSGGTMGFRPGTKQEETWTAHDHNKSNGIAA